MKRFLLYVTILLVLLTACSQGKKTLSDEILGSWRNTDGYTIEFRSAGNGFIPGVPGKIPDSNFAYAVIDASHISIDFEGHQNTIEIVIHGDQMTWKDNLGEVSYRREKWIILLREQQKMIERPADQNALFVIG